MNRVIIYPGNGGKSQMDARTQRRMDKQTHAHHSLVTPYVKCVHIATFLSFTGVTRCSHGDVIKWKHFPRYWPFVRPVTRGFDIFFDLRLNNGVSKQSRRRWIETKSRPLYITVMERPRLHSIWNIVTRLVTITCTFVYINPFSMTFIGNQFGCNVNSPLGLTTVSNQTISCF